jgi:hypothetical protein
VHGWILDESPGSYHSDTPPDPGECRGDLEVLVGDTVVHIDTSYEGETLAALVTSIQPFDLDAEIARLSALAQEMWSDPGSTPLGPSMPLGPFGPLALYGPPS